MAQSIIRGAEPRLLLVAEENRDEDILPKLQNILGLLDTWYEVDVVILTAECGLLFEDGRRLTEKLCPLGNPVLIQRTDRSVSSTTWEKRWSP